MQESRFGLCVRHDAAFCDGGFAAFDPLSDSTDFGHDNPYD